MYKAIGGNDNYRNHTRLSLICRTIIILPFPKMSLVSKQSRPLSFLR